MEGALPILFLAVILKVPVFFAIWLVWWAVKDEPTLEDASGESDDHAFKRWRRDPIRPRGPRRGPHGGAARALPDCPPGGRERAPVTTPAPARDLAGRRRRERAPAGA